MASSVNGELRKRVAAVVEPDDEAVAEEVVAAHAVDLDQILDPGGRGHARA